MKEFVATDYFARLVNKRYIGIYVLLCLIYLSFKMLFG